MINKLVLEKTVYNSNCVFCKIIQKQIQATIVKETENIIVIKDLYPKSPYHYLIMPKIHIENLCFIKDEELNFLSEMGKIARDLAKEIAMQNNMSEPIAFNLVSNNGANAGQSVFHIHWHFLAGKNIYKDGLKL